MLTNLQLFAKIKSILCSVESFWDEIGQEHYGRACEEIGKVEEELRGLKGLIVKDGLDEKQTPSPAKFHYQIWFKDEYDYFWSDTNKGFYFTKDSSECPWKSKSQEEALAKLKDIRLNLNTHAFIELVFDKE